MSASREDSSAATSCAAALSALTGTPSIAAMSMPRPKWWLLTEPPAVSLEWSLHMQLTVILCSSESLDRTATTRGSIRPALMSATPSPSSTTFLFSNSASAAASGVPPLPSAPNCAGSIDPPEGGASTAGAGVGAASAAATCGGAAGAPARVISSGATSS